MKKLKWIIPLSAVAIVAVVAVVAYMLRPYEPVIYEPGTIIYQSENITAKVVEPIFPYQEVMPYYPSASAEEVFGGHPVIATGTVRNIREVEITHHSEGEEYSRVYTLFDFCVSEYVKETSREIRRDKVLTVGWPASSYFYIREYPKLSDGAEFLLFLQTPEDIDESIQEYGAFTDVWVYHVHSLAIPKQGGQYTLSHYFEKYVPDEDKSWIATDLIDIIKKKVKEYS